MSQVEKRRMCPQCRAFITTNDKICPYCNTEVAPKAYQSRAPSDALGGIIPHARFTTVMILLINTGLYVAMVAHSMRSNARGGGLDLDPQTLFVFGAKYGPALQAGQWWRLITAGFLHGGLLHILMNSWVLFDLGAQAEETYGTSRYLTLYFISTITGFLASAYWSPTLSIGSSAGIFGLLGCMIAAGVRDKSSYGSAMRGMYLKWAIYGFLMGLIPGFFGIFAADNAAHLGGVAGGFIVGFAAGTPGSSTIVERFWQIAAGISLAITGLAFFQMAMFLISAK
jgi:rhomboid protease GluP